MMDRNAMERSKEDSKLPSPCALWPVELKLMHVDCNPGDTLVHFQGQYATVCELDYNILQVEIQNAPKTEVAVGIGELCLVEDVLSSRWYRGRVQNKRRDSLDVFLLDHGNVITVDPEHLAAVSDALLMLPPKIVCGFFANVLPIQECWDKISEKYFFSLIGSHIKGFIHALLPYKVLILEVPEITKALLKLSLGKHVDTDTFLLLVEILIEVPIQQSIGSIPDLLIEKQIAHEISFKPSSLQGFENILSFGDSKLIAGQKERVRITAAVNSGLFYCQLSSVANVLRAMSEKLALVCESRSSNSRNKPFENLGLLCAIKGKDEKWHRGFVQCLPVSSQVRVVFVDYGYCESVKVENILQLPSDFLQTPIMAFPCSLSCLNDKDENKKSQQLQIFKNGLLGKELEVAVDDLNKDNSFYSVTLTSVEEYAHIKTLQSKDTDELENSDILKSNLNLNHDIGCCTSETKKCNPAKDSVTFEDLQEHSVFEAYVEHVQSPNDFWIRTAERNNDFEKMMNKLSAYFSGLQLNQEILEDPEPGVFCCAMYEKDMHYYRALVVDILDNGAEVFFIDFGNTEKVPSMLIKKLPREFAMEPEFAFSCSLAHVTPVEDVWTVAATEFFRKATLNKLFLVHVIHKRKDTFVVELYEKGTGKNESITALMVKANMAECWRYNLTSSPAETAENKMDRKKCGQGQIDESSLEKVTQKPLDKGTSKGDRQSHETVITKQTHFESPKSIANAAVVYRQRKLQPGFEVSVQCSCVNSPSEFWCQEKKLKGDLDRLMEDLQAFYQIHSPELQPYSICCAVKFKQDNRWYRGRILRVKNEKVELIFVDYGMVVKENLENIRALMPSFLELEGQAFRCSLYNLIEPVGKSVWSEKASTLLKDFVSESSSNLTCKVYSQLCVANKGLCNVVDLHTPTHQASVHLVEHGVAVRIQHPKPLVPTAYPCSFVYSSFNISIGSEELVYATHVVSPWEIYFHLDRNSEAIEELMESVTKASGELLNQTYGMNTGTVCLAKYFGDNKWYRSCVWPAQSNLHLNVFFVDYGNKQVAEKRNVLPIPQKAVDLLFTPMQALKGSLSNIQEEEHLPEVTKWLEKNILNKALNARFVAKDNRGHFICDIFDGNVHINDKVRELFALQKHKECNSVRNGSGCCKQVIHVCTTDNKLKSKEKIHVGKQGNRQVYQMTSPKFNFAPHRPNVNVSKHYQGKGERMLRQVKSIVKGHKFSRACTFNTQTSKVLPKMTDLPSIKIRPGFRGVGFISHCNSVESFFIQMENDEASILKLGEELNSNMFTKKCTSQVNIGDLVAAQYEEDQALYRAVVTNVASSDILTVEFVDYGNTATVDWKKIYPLTSRFLSQARLSTLCTLSKSHSSEDVEAFIKEQRGTPVMIEFLLNHGNAWEVSVEIIDTSHKSRNGTDGAEDQIPSPQQAEPSQELYIAETETKDEMHTHSESEFMLKEGTEANPQGCEPAVTTKKVVQQKSMEKRRGKRSPAYERNSKRHRKPKYASKIQHAKKQNGIESELEKKLDIPDIIRDFEKKFQSQKIHSYAIFSSNTLDASVKIKEGESIDEQDVRVREYLSVVDQPVLASTYPQNPMDKEDLAQYMFFAPVEVDFEYSGFAASITTPYEFYIVLDDLLLLMNAVSNILEEPSEVFSPLLESHVIPGTGCLVKSDEKNKWCRAEIVQCDDTTVIINMVDYGHYACFQRHDVPKLKRLPIDLAGLPKITYPCMLRGIKPAGAIQWSDNAVVFFQEQMCQKNLQIYFRQYVSEAHWEVDVVVGGSSIAKQLVDAGYACYIDSVLEVQFQQSLDHSVSQEILENIPETTSSKQVESDAEKPYGNLCKMWSSDNTAKSTEENVQSSSRQRDTEVSFTKSCDYVGSRQKAEEPGLRQCMLM